MMNLGINIGSNRTVYSICGYNQNGTFLTKTLLNDASKRETPSLLVFTKKERKAGSTAITDFRTNAESSFINISRLIGLNYLPNIEDELKYSYVKSDIKDEGNNKKVIFKFKFEEKFFQAESNEIVASYIQKINKQYLKNNSDFQFENLTISIPDFYSLAQKQAIKIILKAVGAKKINIINESTAITFYYGYNRHKDFFKPNKDIVKNVIFVDSGHSKTTFFLSQFKFNEFKVLYVKSIPFLGGRDFDEALFKYAQNKFLMQFHSPFPDAPKYKLRLMESIIKQRKQLTVNNEVTITIESIKDDEDFSFVLTRELFHSIIASQIQEFSSKYMEFLHECQEILPLNEIHAIEMAGELLRTPTLQDIVTQLTQIKEVSKTILVDECTSAGAALFTAYALKQFPVKQFQFITGYNMYDIYYTIDGDSNSFRTFVSSGSQLPISKDIFIKINSGNVTKCLIDFYYNKDNIEDFSKSHHLIQYTFDLKNIKKNNKNFTTSNNLIYLFFIVRQSSFIKFHKITNGNKEELNFNDNNVIKSKSGIFKTNDDEEDSILGLTSILNEHDEIDKKIAEMENKKIEVSKSFYKLKNEMKKIKELNENTQRGREVLERMNIINKKIRDLNKYNVKREESGIKRINSIKQHLNDIITDFNIGSD